jgi:NADH pyrophosphatase NudC (nudix superfamily)
MRAIKKKGNYRLYRVENHLELWSGTYKGKNSYLAGYVANAENFEYAIDVAEENMRYLMAEPV